MALVGEGEAMSVDDILLQQLQMLRESVGAEVTEGFFFFLIQKKEKERKGIIFSLTFLNNFFAKTKNKTKNKKQNRTI